MSPMGAIARETTEIDYTVIVVGDDRLPQRSPCPLVLEYEGTRALVTQFIRKQTLDNMTTLMDVVLDGEEVRIDIGIVDITEILSFRKDRKFRFGEGFLLVFSITNRRSFDAAIELREQILSANKEGSRIPLLLVGNNSLLENERVVSSDEATALAATWGVRYVETCTETRAKVDKVFFDIMREIRKNFVKKLSEKQEQGGNSGREKQQKCCKFCIL